MAHVDWMILSIAGLVAAAVGGLGNHLLSNFRGRALEAYSRMKGRRERFGAILDGREDAQTATNYLFILGASIALTAGITWLCFAWNWSDAGTLASTPISVWQLTSVGVIATGILASLYSWIPKILVRNSASVLLFHTWWLWQGVSMIAKPFRALEYLFLSVGYRLSDSRIDRAWEEESLEDEIRKMVMVGERDGLVTRSMRDMITSVMNLDEGQVSQIMTPRSQVDAIDVSLSWEDILTSIISSGRTRIPCYEESLDNIVGILFVKDLLPLLSKGDNQLDGPQLRRILREAWLIPGTRKVDELLKDFLVRRNHMAIVVDEFQQTIGVVTIEDALEEIVGEIADELDEEETKPLYMEEPTGGFSVAGTMEVAAANRQMSLELPESDEYETIAGMVITATRTLPQTGTEIGIGRYNIKVTQSTPRQVARVSISFAQSDLPKEAGRAVQE
jgi:CBS domain containing-hemolysin-like protein